MLACKFWRIIFMKVKIIIVCFLVSSLYPSFVIYGASYLKDESLLVAKTADRNYGEELTQAVITENYDDLLRIFGDMANDFQMNPKEDCSLACLSSIYFLRNEPEKVMELLREFCDEKKSHPVFLHISASCHAIVGHYKKAICNLTKLIDEIEKNKIKYQLDYQNGHLNGVPVDSFGFNNLEEFLGCMYMHRAFLNAILVNTHAAGEDWKKYCLLSKRPELISSFFQCLETLERSPGTLKCVLKKDFPNDYVKIEEKVIFFRFTVTFDWEECACPTTLSQGKAETNCQTDHN